MRIIKCMPFFNENLIANIQLAESLDYSDIINIVETNRTFQYGIKGKNFDVNIENSNIKYNFINVNKIFKKPRKCVPYIDIKRNYNRKGFFFNTSWHNEKKQRNLSVNMVDYDDNDILILCDIDEVLYPQFIDRIIEEVKKRDIITVKLYYTMFYFNLFSFDWPGVPDYSYRLFVVKGKYLREKWKGDYDKLRNYGTNGHLLDEVYCLNDFAGFHHSWIGDEEFISKKLSSFAHVEFKHLNNKEYIGDCLRSGKSIFPNNTLEKRSDIDFLESVKKFKDSTYFV